MKKILSLLLFAGLVNNSFATDFEQIQFESTTRVGIVNLESPNEYSDNYIAYATDGRIYEISADSKEIIVKAKMALEDQVEVEINIGENTESEDITGFRTEIYHIELTNFELESSVEINSTNRIKDNSLLSRSKINNMLLNSYITNLSSSYDADNIFREQRTDTRQKSQCYNRAHVWSWEMSRQNYNGRSIQPGKIWVFFTQRYIRNYRYKWWFHISPYLNVNNELVVMDKSFTSSPISERAWTNRFVRSEAACPVVAKYTDYRNNQYANDCYVIKTSAFYWQPWHIENVEKNGTIRSGWNEATLRQAYKDAIGRRASILR